MKNLQEEEEKLKLLNQIIEARKSPNSDEIFSDQEKDEEKEHENDEELEGLIKELVIETPHKQSTSLRIITNDFQSKMYQAGSLRDKTWTKLKEYLLKKEIKVRNETYH